ncbi:hypothetical protein [Actinomycetospora sp. NBC_00405]|uniref:hypothetical protein n=1 Tax=Actinomycetospora sp. NBC_00405 TaxID=2975952 RepID=UPI002E1D144F
MTEPGEEDWEAYIWVDSNYRPNPGIRRRDNPDELQSIVEVLSQIQRDPNLDWVARRALSRDIASAIYKHRATLRKGDD